MKYDNYNTVTQVEAARMLGVTKQAVFTYITQGRLKVVDVNGKPRVPVTQVMEFTKPSHWKDIRKAVHSYVKDFLRMAQHDEAADLATFYGQLGLGLMFDPMVTAALKGSKLKYRTPEIEEASSDGSPLLLEAVEA